MTGPGQNLLRPQASQQGEIPVRSNMHTTGQYLWKDESLETIESALGQRVKNASWTPGDPWAAAGQQPGIKIWRISEGRLSPWPPEENGNFFDEDVFIVLKTHFADVMSSDLSHDIHLWVGKRSSLEDYNSGTLMVPSLRRRLASRVLVHREVSGRESENFRSYFTTITVSRGKGSDSYRYNPDDTYSARLYRYYKPDSRTQYYRLKEVSPLKSNLQAEHHYVLDIGQKVYLWAGHVATPDEKLKAIEHCERLCGRRGPNTIFEVLDELTSDGHYFYFYLQTRNEESLLDSDDDTAANVTRQATLSRKKESEVRAFRITVKATPPIEFKRMKASRKEMIGQGPCLVDVGTACFIWLGRKSERGDIAYSLHYAHEYLRQTTRPFVPVTIVTEGEPCPAFNRAVPG